MKIADFVLEKALGESYPDARVVGVDEAGRGPLAGPVVAAACVLRAEPDTDDPLWDLVRDSKKLSEKQREKAYQFVLDHYVVGVGEVSSEAIDRMNILQATFLAMKSAVGQVVREVSRDHEQQPYVLMVDGSQMIPHISHPQKTYTKGDSRVKCIAAASIVAKVVRDQKMKDYDMLYPQYGFGAHKGYGTKAHIEALQKHGATPVHRKSFGPVKRAM